MSMNEMLLQLFQNENKDCKKESVFTGIVAMDPAAPIFDTNSKGTLEIFESF